MLVEKAYVGITPEKPQQFVNNGLQVAFFGRDEWEALRQVESHLVAKYGECPRARAVGFFVSMFKDVPHEFKILVHGVTKLGEAAAQPEGEMAYTYRIFLT